VLIYCLNIGNAGVLNRVTRKRQLVSVAAGLVVCLTAGPSWRARTEALATSLTFAAAGQTSSTLPAFRLGTAAGSLGWSTAVADFNTDGTPDVAIADRVSYPIGAASYRIEFSISGREPKTVAFQSDQDALTIKVSDVDHDNDLDVVVSGALSREVVGVWLNDGNGHFKPSDARPFAGEVGLRHSLNTADPSADSSGAGLAPRGADALPQATRWTTAIPRRVTVSVQSARLHSELLFSSASPRAPPRPVPHSLS
jgi:hypothetical protein